MVQPRTPFYRVRFAVILCLCAFFCASSYSENRIDYIFDLDQIILYSTRHKGDNTVRADHKEWEVAVGAPELIESLLLNPHARVSFFSARSKDRNVEAMKKIKLSDRRSFFEVANGRIYSAEEMKREGDFKVKDFEDLIPGVNPDRAFLIDDNVSPVSQNHRKNLLWVYYRDRNKRLAIVRGLIEASLDKAKAQRITPVEALFSLQYKNDGDGELRVERVEEDGKYAREGEHLFKKVNPHFMFPTKSDVRSSRQSPTHKMKDMIKKSIVKSVLEAKEEDRETEEKIKRRLRRAKKLKGEKKKKALAYAEEAAIKKTKRQTILPTDAKFPRDCYIIMRWIDGKI